MAEAGRSAAVGSVEEEAHKLVQAASEWLQSRQEQATPHTDGPHADSDPAARPAGEDPDAGSAGRSAAGDSEPGPAAGHAATGQDSAPPGSAQASCTGCPWCRAKTAVGPIGAETLDGLADLLAAASHSLRLFAESRRAGADPGGPAGSWTAQDDHGYGVDDVPEERP